MTDVAERDTDQQQAHRARPTRLVLTLMGLIAAAGPVLGLAGDGAFLATGEGKREPVARAQAGDNALPAAKIHPVGHLHWFTDRAAARSAARQ